MNTYYPRAYNEKCIDCEYFREANGEKVNLQWRRLPFCHYMLRNGERRPYKFSDCPGYNADGTERKVEK